MLYYIPRTKMLSAAQDSLSPDSKPKSIFWELMTFLLVAMIGSFVIDFLQSSLLSVLMIFDPTYYELYDQMMQSSTFDMQVLVDYMNSFLASLPGEINIIFLALSGIYIIASIIYCKCLEKRSLFSMGFNKRGIVPEYLLGLCVGAVMISLPALICYITGCVTFSFDASVSPLVIALFFIAFILQGMGEEVLFRGYLLTSLTRRHNAWVAIVVSAVMFSVFHIPNANFSIIAFINIVLFGIFAGVFMLKRGSIWAVGAIHAAWNFMQGNIFGISVSGNAKLSSVLESANADFGSILSGGDFGLEGGLGVTIVLLVALLLVLMMPAKKSEAEPSDTNSAAK